MYKVRAIADPGQRRLSGSMKGRGMDRPERQEN